MYIRTTIHCIQRYEIKDYGILWPNVFQVFIPPQLAPQTQMMLRNLMARPLADSDASGYIYALELEGKMEMGWRGGQDIMHMYRNIS